MVCRQSTLVVHDVVFRRLYQVRFTYCESYFMLGIRRYAYGMVPSVGGGGGGGRGRGTCDSVAVASRHFV